MDEYTKIIESVAGNERYNGFAIQHNVTYFKVINCQPPSVFYGI